MTTSSSYSYQLTRDELITASLRKLSVLAEGQTPSTQNLNDGAMALNSAIAMLRSKGLPLWARSEYTFTPTTNVYNIGVGMTLNAPFPVKLLQAVRNTSNAKIPLELTARQDFNILPVSSSGSPLKLNYQPFINYGVISLWPIPDSTNTDSISITYQRPFQYFTSSTETLDFPEEWYNAIVYTTAVLLAPEWSIPLQDRQKLESEADKYTRMAEEVGGEDASFYLQPERRY